MGRVIAMAGKGGVGKTTLCGLLIQHLCRSGKRPVLAVDADANSNLGEVLGVEPGKRWARCVRNWSAPVRNPGRSPRG